MRDDLPTGTVTFLFTDVEGSTKLLHELGDEAYAESLAEHRRLIRAACALKAAGELDLLFCIVYDDFLTVETAQQLRQLGVPMVNYHVDMAPLAPSNEKVAVTPLNVYSYWPGW